MKTEYKKNKIPFSSDINCQTVTKQKFSNNNPFNNNILKSKVNQKIKRIKSAKNKKPVLSSNYNKIQDSNDELNLNNDKNIKTISSDKQIITDDIKYNLKTLKTETKDKSIFNKNYMNNLSLYSTLWYTEEPKYQKTYYSLNNKRKEKMFRDILKKSENFNKYNDNRVIIGIINKFKNKNIEENEFKKYQQFSYRKRIPITVAFGLGKSSNTIPEINNNYNFNK